MGEIHSTERSDGEILLTERGLMGEILLTERGLMGEILLTERGLMGEILNLYLWW